MKKDRLVYLLIAIIVIWMIVLSISFSNNADSKNGTIVNEYIVDGYSTDFTKIADKAKTSVVTINNGGTISSGFVYKQEDNETYIITSYHGVMDAYTINVVFANSYSANADLVGKNEFLDIAVLKINTPFEVEPLVLNDASNLKAGEFVIAIGTPVSLEYSNSIELGMVSALRSIENSITSQDKTYAYYLDTIQLSGKFLSGYSGCPIINMNGDVAGVVTMSYSTNFNFAVTANEVKIVADKLINNETVLKHQFGIKGLYLSDMHNYEKSSLDISLDVINGLYVDKISEQSSLYNAGVRKGDVITSINGFVIKNLDDYLNICYSNTNSFTFSVARNDYTFDVVVNIDA